MRNSKAQMDIKMIVIAVIAVVIAIAFIPIFITTISSARFVTTDFLVLNETHAITAGTPIGLSNVPLKIDTITVFNSTDLTQINETDAHTGFSVLFLDNATINFTLYSGDASFNYTQLRQNDTGIGTTSIVLLSLVVFLFVAFIIVLAIKKFLNQ